MIADPDMDFTYFLYVQHNGESYEYHHILKVDRTTCDFSLLENPDGFNGHNPECLDKAHAELIGFKPSPLINQHTSFLNQRILPPLTDEEIDGVIERGENPRNTRTYFLLNANKAFQLPSAIHGYTLKFIFQQHDTPSIENGGGASAASSPDKADTDCGAKVTLTFPASIPASPDSEAESTYYTVETSANSSAASTGNSSPRTSQPTSPSSAKNRARLGSPQTVPPNLLAIGTTTSPTAS